MSQLDVVNIVGSGSLSIELDLDAVAQDLGNIAKHDPDDHTGMHIRLENGALVTLYRTGSYHVVGVKSETALFNARDALIEKLRGLNIPVSDDIPDGDEFGVRNIVCTADFGADLNLNALTIGFGLENVEYEPEQFPGLVYRPPDHECVMLLFASGKVVLTGSADITVLENAFNGVRGEIRELLGTQ